MPENCARPPRYAHSVLAVLFGFVLLVGFALVSARPGWSFVAGAGPGTQKPVPVVVELFTSEGCSSCPPADKFLANLDRAQPVAGALIIPLEEHVDYWDRDGWHDPFSSPVFTDRQVEYAQRFGLSGPATPQLVVAGRAHFYLNSMPKSREAILEAMQAPQARVSVALVGGRDQNELLASIGVQDYPSSLAKKDEKAEVRLAVTEDSLASDVHAGENSGKHLEHRAVVRKLLSAGEVKPDHPFSGEVKVPLAKQWNREHLRIVVFLEAHGSHQIVGAATAPVSP